MYLSTINLFVRIIQKILFFIIAPLILYLVCFTPNGYPTWQTPNLIARMEFNQIKCRIRTKIINPNILENP